MRKLVALVVVLAACGLDKEPPPPPDAHPWGVPISGGTLLVSQDGSRAVVGDPDRDRIVVVDLAARTVTHEIALTPGDEPGRMVEDAAGRIDVALRRGGAIVTLDPVAGTILLRRPVCAEPRGLAYSPTDNSIIVACTDGQLVTFPAGRGDATRRVQLDRDLRDVVVSGDQLVVTRFRTADIITLDATGAVVSQTAPPTVTRDDFDLDTGQVSTVDADAEVAWRTVGLADGRVIMTHQRHLQKPLGTMQTGGYGGGCHGGPVEDAITVSAPGGTPIAVMPGMFSVLPVDIAVSPDQTMIGVVDAGQQMVRTFSATALSTVDPGGCPPGFVDNENAYFDGFGAPTSVAFTPTNDLIAFYPEAPALVIHPGNFTGDHSISLPGGVGYDAGRELFHTVAGVGLACASCHPEGRDDGQVWEFSEFGFRRTQSVAGHILQRAPYHWTGDQADLPSLLSEVFEHRMAGGPLTPSQVRDIGPWLDRIPAPAPVGTDAAAIARGQALFESADVGCVQCHNGPLMTTNQRVDVGTGGTFKVPSLRGVVARPPYLHDGCAPTLIDRLTSSQCGGGDRHGHTSQLDAGQLADLVAYVESL